MYPNLLSNCDPSSSCIETPVSKYPFLFFCSAWFTILAWLLNYDTFPTKLYFKSFTLLIISKDIFNEEKRYKHFDLKQWIKPPV